MNIQSFLVMLSVFSVISSLITEAIKKLVSEKENASYNIIALVTSIIVGGGGSLIYYQLNTIPFTINNIIYAVLMGIASGVVAMVGYDKVMQTLKQLGKCDK